MSLDTALSGKAKGCGELKPGELLAIRRSNDSYGV